MALLNRDQIIAADRKKHIDVPVKEWGGTVRLQELSASERDQWESELTTTDPDGNAKYNPRHGRARLLVRCIVDESGKRLFSDDEVAAVGSLSASAAQRLFNAAVKLNAISQSDVDELEGNSEAA